MITTKLLLILITFGILQHASAKLVQIIHTNDLHSYFDGTRNGQGGYARIKTLIDQLKAEASAKGIPTLVLDGGDFGEGSSFFFSENGRASLKALDMLGIDVSVLGNHDFILGGKELARQIKDSGTKTKILSANFKGKKWMGLSQLMPDYVDYDIDGLKIRIMGLTTTEVHFQYPLRPLGFIGSSHRAGIKIAEQSQREDVDFLIALTHTGLPKDRTLVEHSRSIGLVVGGHTHIRLDKPVLAENLLGKQIPIVQTGAHGIAIGSMLLDLHGKREFTVIDYRLHDITSDMEADPVVTTFVQEAYASREKYFNRSWDEVIGFSEIPFNGYVNGNLKGGSYCWSKHMARMTRLAAKTDLGLQFDQFQGEEIQPGPITFGDMIDNYPHFRSWGDKGWVVARARMSGLVLKKLIGIFSKGDDPVVVTIDGLKIKRPGSSTLDNFKLREDDISSALVEGEEIHSLAFYTVSFPSEVSFGVGRLSQIASNLLFRNLQYTERSYWPLLEDYIRTHSPLTCLKD
jgi:5'-nucleotidase / UDP-sugar diphosphatase